MKRSLQEALELKAKKNNKEKDKIRPHDGWELSKGTARGLRDKEALTPQLPVCK